MIYDLATVLAALYASEINFDIHSFWDAGVEVSLGDQQNGFKAVRTFERNELDAIAGWLRSMTIEHYPTSKFSTDCKVIA